MPVDHVAEVSDVPIGRRERRRRELRDRLFEVAIELFVANGYEATTMDTIAEHADVARATVFNHYPQKARFLEEWGRRRRAYVIGVLERTHLADLPAPDQIRAYLGEMARLNEESRPVTTVLADAGARYGEMLTDTEVSAELAHILEIGRRRGQIRPDVDLTQAAHLLSGAYLTTMLRWCATEPPFDLTATLDAVADVVLRGLLP